MINSTRISFFFSSETKKIKKEELEKNENQEKEQVLASYITKVNQSALLHSSPLRVFSRKTLKKNVEREV